MRFPGRSCPRRETETQGIREATFAGQTASPDQVANRTMATLPTRAQPDQGVGQHVGHCKSHWRKDGVVAQRSQSRGPLHHGSGTGEGPRSANAPFNSFDRPQQAMFVHQSRTTVSPLTRSRTTSCAHQIWAVMPGNFAPDVSTQCEKVMTFATEQNHVSNVGLALEIDWQRRMGIICAERAAAFTTKAQGR